jgi:hypothetical protein
VSRIAEYGPPIDGSDNGHGPGLASEESLRLRKSIGKRITFQMGKNTVVGTIVGFEAKYHSVSVEYTDKNGIRMIAYVKLGRVTSYGVEA